MIKVHKSNKPNHYMLYNYQSRVAPAFPHGWRFTVRFSLTPEGEMWHGRGTTPSKAAAFDRIEEYRRNTIARERLGER